jgi:GDPmannose 4,6-dehydratase
MYACNGILFNHESPRRGETFVTRKITRGLSRINHGLDECLYLGNLDAKRDWGHAKDYVEMMWKMLQNQKAEDFVISTGRMETVRRFCELTALRLGWGNKNEQAIIWEGKGINEIGRRNDTGEVVIKVDSRYFRPTEVNHLLGNAEKAKNKLGWEAKTSLEEMIAEMVQEDEKIISSMKLK